MQTWLRRIMALIAMVGSFYGLAAVYSSIGRLSLDGGGLAAMSLTALGALLFLFGIMCGFWLLERRPFSIMANIIFWALQVPVVATALVTWKMYALANMSITTSPGFSSFGIESNGPESAFLFDLRNHGEEALIGINLFALLMIVLLVSIAISTRREKSLLSGVKKAASMAGGAAAMTGSAVVSGAKGAVHVADKAADMATDVAEMAKAGAGRAADLVESSGKATAETATGITRKAADMAEETAKLASASADAAATTATKTIDRATDAATATAPSEKAAEKPDTPPADISRETAKTGTATETRKEKTGKTKYSSIKNIVAPEALKGRDEK